MNNKIVEIIGTVIGSIIGVLLVWIISAGFCILLGAIAIKALTWFGVLTTFSWKYALGVGAILWVLSTFLNSCKSK